MGGSRRDLNQSKTCVWGWLRLKDWDWKIDFYFQIINHKLWAEPNNACAWFLISVKSSSAKIRVPNPLLVFKSLDFLCRLSFNFYFSFFEILTFWKMLISFNPLLFFFNFNFFIFFFIFSLEKFKLKKINCNIVLFYFNLFFSYFKNFDDSVYFAYILLRNYLNKLFRNKLLFLVTSIPIYQEICKIHVNDSFWNKQKFTLRVY